MFNPYTVLGLDYSASLEDCKKQYKRLCAKYHPDNGGDPDKFDAVNKAYKMIESGAYDISKVLKKKRHLQFKSLFSFEPV